MDKFVIDILRLFLLSVALLANHAGAAAPAVTSVIVHPWDLAQQPDILSDLGGHGINTVTLYVSWRDVEPEEGVFVFDKFDWQLNKIRENGMKAILILDFGGRTYLDENGYGTKHTVIPDWIHDRYPATFMRNSLGEVTRQLSLVDETIRDRTSRFVKQAVKYFYQKYEAEIFGFAIGLQEEHEIKYGQEGYVWRDYSDLARGLFQEKYQQDLPIINYNNDIFNATPQIDHVYPKLQADREATLKRATCGYAEIIRSYKQNVVGYFGEVFTSHDAIYAGGIVEELVDCIDIAVIDFNFYDGYELKPELYTLPMLANYLESTGYKKIIVGAYAERWVEKGKGIELPPVIRKSLEKAQRITSVIGYEIGGFYYGGTPTRNGRLDIAEVGRAAVDRVATSEVGGEIKIGLLASKSNFYFWHGERSNERNVHQDALTRAYALLTNSPRVQVVVIGESVLKNNAALMQTLDALVVPHQASLSVDVKENLKEYWSSGGVLVQDMRLGEFDDTGKATGDWLHDVFGIGGLEWSVAPAEFEYENTLIELDMKGRTYANHAVLHAAPGYEVRARLVNPAARSWNERLRNWLARRPAADSAAGGQGLILRGERSLVFGFLPQLTEGAEESRWHQIFVDEIVDVAGKSSDE